MARTRNPETHAVKRDAFVEAGMRLISASGYEALSIQDVLDDVGASKGAFYHYFGSKADLLEAVVGRITDGVLEQLTPIARAPGLTFNRQDRLQQQWAAQVLGGAVVPALPTPLQAQLLPKLPELVLFCVQPSVLLLTLVLVHFEFQCLLN